MAGEARAVAGFRGPRKIVKQNSESIAGHVASPLAGWWAQACGADTITFENLKRPLG
jgi:hypothetical protein